MRPSFSNPSRAVGPICHARRENGVDGPPSWSLSGQYSRPRRPRPEGRDLRRRSAAGHQRRHQRGAGRTRHAGQSPRRRRRPADRRLRPPRRHSLPRRALAGQANSRGAPPPHQQCQRLSHQLKQWLNRFNGSPPKTCQAISLAQSPRSLGQTVDPPKWILSAIERTISTDNAIRAQITRTRAKGLCLGLTFAPADALAFQYNCIFVHFCSSSPTYRRFDRRSDDRLEQLIASGRSPMSRCINSPNPAPSQNPAWRKLRPLGDGLPSESNRSQACASSTGSGAESFGSLNISPALQRLLCYAG